MFIDLPPVQAPAYHFDFLNVSDVVLEKLKSLRRQTFQDTKVALVDALIAFFDKVNIGGNLYFKHYSFFAIWENAVTEYLNAYFLDANEKGMLLSKALVNQAHFEKVAFYPNAVKLTQSIEPDCYYCQAGSQFIFDAKYYTAIRGLDYKQLACLFLLKDAGKGLGDARTYKATYSALVLSSEHRSTALHFQIDPMFAPLSSDLVIYEEYLSIRLVINHYFGLPPVRESSVGYQAVKFDMEEY